MFVDPLAALTLLIFGHLVGDYVLQTDSIARGKNRHVNYEIYSVPWYYWMASHCAVHGGLVYLVTGSIVLALAEFICHFVIDEMKCASVIGLHTDQFGHLLCKMAWVYYM